MKVYGYCRVSTTEQADGGSSLASQQQQITGYAMMKGWDVADFFVEAGVSGSIPLAERPEGQRLLQSLRAGDVVITAKLDRAFRSAADALGTLEQLKEDKVALHMIDLGGDVTGNGISKMVFTILAAVAEGERDRIRERIRDAKRHLTAQGVFSGGKRPFGSDVVEEGDTKRLVANVEEQAVIARMQALRRDGATYRSISAAVGMGPKTVQRILDRVGRVAFQHWRALRSAACAAVSTHDRPRFHYREKGNGPRMLSAAAAVVLFRRYRYQCGLRVEKVAVSKPDASTSARLFALFADANVSSAAVGVLLATSLRTVAGKN